MSVFGSTKPPCFHFASVSKPNRISTASSFWKVAFRFEKNEVFLDDVCFGSRHYTLIVECWVMSQIFIFFIRLTLALQHWDVTNNNKKQRTQHHWLCLWAVVCCLESQRMFYMLVEWPYFFLHSAKVDVESKMWWHAHSTSLDIENMCCCPCCWHSCAGCIVEQWNFFAGRQCEIVSNSNDDFSQCDCHWRI